MLKPSYVTNVLAVARGLLTEDDTNPEYDRAIVEMTTELLGLPITDNKHTVWQLIRNIEY